MPFIPCAKVKSNRDVIGTIHKEVSKERDKAHGSGFCKAASKSESKTSQGRSGRTDRTNGAKRE